MDARPRSRTRWCVTTCYHAITPAEVSPPRPEEAGEATVKTRLGHVFDKLEVADRAAAVARGYELGILG